MSNSDFDTGYAAGWAAAWNNENETEAEYSRKEIASLRTELVAYCNQRETDAARVMALQIQMDEAARRDAETIASLRAECGNAIARLKELKEVLEHCYQVLEGNNEYRADAARIKARVALLDRTK